MSIAVIRNLITGGEKKDNYLVKDGVIKSALYASYLTPTAWGSLSHDQHTIIDNQSGYVIIKDNGDQWQEYGTVYFTAPVDTSKYSGVQIIAHGVSGVSGRFGIAISSDVPPNVASGSNYTTIQFDEYSSGIPTTDTQVQLGFNQSTGMVYVSIPTGYSRGSLGLIGTVYLKEVKLIPR